MRPDYDFLLSLRVHDVQALRRAALAHEDAQPDQDFLTPDGDVDVGSCLVMLLDPGHLEGCSIQNSAGAAGEGADEGEFEFGMWLTVHSPEVLRAAALQHEDAQPDDQFIDDQGEVDIDSCLVMMLDPGSLPGCSIHSSSSTRADALLVELENTPRLRM